MTDRKLCMLGCGNLGTPILSTLLSNTPNNPLVQFTHYTACVSSASSSARLTRLFASHISSGKLSIAREPHDICAAISSADIVLLAVDPAQVVDLVSRDDVKAAFNASPSSDEKGEDGGTEKLLISLVAGLSVAHLRSLISSSSSSTSTSSTLHILRAMPNVCAQVSHSLTAIEILPSSSSSSSCPQQQHLETATLLFEQIGETQLVPAALMPAATAVGGSTPAFWAVIVDALVDAGVATGMPRDMAQKMIYASMRGSAEMLMEGGLQPSGLRDIGTSPAGCTIAGIMVLEEMGVRGAVGKALRESVTTAKEMGREGEKTG